MIAGWGLGVFQWMRKIFPGVFWGDGGIGEIASKMQVECGIYAFKDILL